MSDERQDPPVVSGPETAPLPASLPPLPQVLAAPASPSPGHELPRTLVQRVGRYEVVRELASGGMGVVYEAIQDQPRRSVALKLMRAGLGSQGAVARFEHESQLLARLRHPGIAQVYDAGTYQHGALTIPYFAMEYIPGARPITEFAELRRMDIRERIGLMIKVCDAVQHGHEKGIIHRDLKPANILIDTNGEPKVIDFGVARASDTSEQSSATQQTDASQLIGTLPYMSPEQYESDPRHLDGRSDVYSLGVVLYELLCGRLPHEVSRAKLSDAARMICQDPPPRPSTVKPDLRGDIETVLLKSLQKDRERRYASAADLRDDLSRALAGEPIRARGDSLGYLLGTRIKWLVSRHRISAAVAAIVFAVALARWVALPVVAQWTSANHAYERFLTTRLAAIPNGPAMQNVRAVVMNEGTDFAGIAKAEGLKGVANGDKKSLRRLHGRLMEKLATSGAKVVAFDVNFPDPTEFDADFVRGVGALKSAGVDVVVTSKSWQTDASGLPALSPTIADAVKWGGVTSDLGGSHPWRIIAAVRSASSEIVPSFALTIAAAFEHPGQTFNIEFNRQDDNLLGMRFAQPAPARAVGRRPPSTLELWRITRMNLYGRDDPVRGLQQDTITGDLMLELPSDGALAGSSVDYAQLFRASPDQLREWFSGRAVIVADGRAAGGDPVVASPDGRKLRAHVANEVAVDSLIRKSPIQLPRTRILFGYYVPDVILIETTAAALGVVVALVAGRRWVARVVLYVLAAALVVAGSILAYQRFHYLYMPAVAVVAMLVAGEIVAWVQRVRHRVGYRHPAAG